jgi:hypothetical protein
LAAPNLSGQTYLGGIRGTVRDAGGVIPGATVVLVDEATNETRTTLTKPAEPRRDHPQR